ncbi:MAG: MFS transporter [Rhodospirillales bacterium]
MFSALAPVAALLLSVAFLLMGSGLQNTLVPVRAEIEGFQALVLGGLGAAYYFGFMIGCIAAPLIVQRAGHIRSFVAMVSIGSSVALVHPIFVEPWTWIGLRIITGFCLAGLFMIIESWLNEQATNESRGVIFSTYLGINLSVITIGQLLITIDDPEAFSLFALASILVSLAAVPLSLTRSQEPVAPNRVKLRILRLYRMSPVGLVGSFSVGLSNGAFWTLGPVFAAVSGDGAESAAVFMAVGALAGAAGQWPIGRLSDRMDRRIIIMIACLLAAIADLLMAIFGSDDPTFRLICVAGFGVFALPIYALAAAHMNDMVTDSGFVEAAGGLLLTFSIGAVLGPLVASAAISLMGPAGLFSVIAAVHLSMTVFVASRMRIRRAKPNDERGDFTEAALAAQTVAAVEELEPSTIAD